MHNITTSSHVVPPLPTTTQVEAVFADLTARGDLIACQAGLFAFANGLRRGEIVGLRWADLDFANRVISISVPGSRARRVPMSARVHDELVGRQPTAGNTAYVFLPDKNRTAAGRRLESSLRMAGSRLGVNVTFGSLRRKFATDFPKTDGSMCELARTLGTVCWRRADCLIAYCRTR